VDAHWCGRRTALRAGLLALSLVCLSACKKEEQAAPAPLEVKVVEAVSKDVPLYREWVGQTYGILDIEIRARVAGWLQGIHFNDGTEVQKGALLYTIDQSELQQAVAEAEARVAQARTLMVRAKSDVDRYGPLAEAGAVSQRDLESAQAEYGARQAEVEAAGAQLRVAEINLGYATIRAPISGLIGISAARVGDFVGRAPNVIILNTISRIDTIRVKFSITEQEYLDIMRRISPEPGTRRGDRVSFELVLADGSVFPSTGHLLYAQRQVDPATGTLQFEVAFPNTGRVLRPGQFARVRTAFEMLKGATVVPARAVMEIQGQPVLYTVGPENKAEFRRLKAGPVVAGMRVVQEGVKPGEKVIVDGIQRVRPDMIVAPVPLPADSLAPATPQGGGN
jgi:membrane fusion protein (multidrug efflux system)